MEQHERSVGQVSGASDRPDGRRGRGGRDPATTGASSIPPTTGQKLEITEEDLQQVEAEIKALERKKREMEVRLSEMERDLGGLLR